MIMYIGRKTRVWSRQACWQFQPCHSSSVCQQANIMFWVNHALCKMVQTAVQAAMMMIAPEDEIVSHVVALDALVRWALIKRRKPLCYARVAGMMTEGKAPHDRQVGAQAFHCRCVHNVRQAELPASQSSLVRPHSCSLHWAPRVSLSACKKDPGYHADCHHVSQDQSYSTPSPGLRCLGVQASTPAVGVSTGPLASMLTPAGKAPHVLPTETPSD